MAGYWELSMVVDGAEAGVVIRKTDKGREAFLAEVIAFGVRPGGLVEVFALWHGHDDDGDECVCVQYSTDHRPVWSSAESVVVAEGGV